MSHRTSPGKPPSQRQLRAGELIRHAVVEILQRENLREPGLSGVSITVSEVRASPDLRHASVFCMPLGGDDAGPVIAALNRAAPHIRHLLGGKIDLRYTPDLKFLADESFAEARRIDELLASPAVARDLRDDEA